MFYKKAVFIFLLVFLFTFTIFSDDIRRWEYDLTANLSYNHYIHFAQSVGDNFLFFDIGSQLFFPMPIINPFVSVGIFSCIETGTDAQYSWTHHNIFGKAGAEYSYDITNFLSMSMDISAGGVVKIKPAFRNH